MPHVDVHHEGSFVKGDFSNRIRSAFNVGKSHPVTTHDMDLSKAFWEFSQP